MAESSGSFARAQREAGAALERALSSRLLGAGDALGAAGDAAAPGLRALRDVAAGEAFLLPHLLLFTRRTLRAAFAGDAGADARAALAAAGTDADDEADVWAHAEAAPVEGDASADARWAVPAVDVMRMRHADEPCFGVAPLPSDVAATAGLRQSGCVAWALRDVAAGEEATRDVAPGRRRTLSRAATLLGLLPPRRWAHVAEHAALAAALAAAAGAPLPAAQPRPPPKTPPLPLADPPPPVRIYTDYAELADALRSDPGFEVADEPSGIDVLWLNTPLRNFAELPPGLLVNQFPYEGCLVRKDLLPQTCRAAAAAAGGAPGAFPPWFPECYDLATEAAAFRCAHERAGGDGAAAWVVKRAGGTHSADAAVTWHAACVLRHALAPVGGDRVAQRYVRRPALLSGRRKFDVRVYVAVRSFSPLVAAVDGRYYGRVASSPFTMSPDSLAAFDTHFTVGWYAQKSADQKDVAPSASSPQQQQQPADAADAPPPPPPLLGRAALEAAAAAAGLDWSAADAAMKRMLRQLFAAAGGIVGSFPAGRALYGCDVLFEEVDSGSDSDTNSTSTIRIEPRLLEVNFAGDLATLLRRVPGGAPGFVPDVAAFLLRGAAADGGAHGLQSL